jgi:hypothetical protein
MSSNLEGLFMTKTFPSAIDDRSTTAPSITNFVEKGNRLSSEVDILHPSKRITNSAVSHADPHKAGISS